ncbi:MULTISPECIES: sugar ABC transporter ATP-binding protein [unclassified Beijerinckia]|uniref:sugar ABC transporter ATP-binding protein n=1 Tax=unclassified Beijerinckia TaxID=2638183 RepID=UPI000896FB24|nr:MULTISPECIES: sugar ABC transporter ATP-binding protein [unclassified Beijerinckia]MDH7796795.1 ribose transport system ATP-binding protein [Beijerinckia sp. GAS462]SEC60147.1 ribose transport system ATP-binding protein [Beijerinckia sp. 28-YEA-48]
MRNSDHPLPGGMASAETAPAGLVRHISKRFGATLALRNVSLAVHRGEALALLGENGAGKSTLIKILSGVYQPDEGEILIDGKPQVFAAPPDAIAAGIVLIPQELQVAGQRSVAENICLSAIPARRMLGFVPSLDRKRMRETSTAILARLGSSIDPDVKVGRLSFAERQMVVVARALTNQAKVLILDEPTASLGDADTERLLDVLVGLKRDGVAIIYITHRLPEVRHIAERCMVLRDGQLAGEFSAQNFDEAAVTLAMSGRTTVLVESRVSARRDESVLAVPLGRRKIAVASGEVVGVAGLIGSGAASSVRKLFGLGDQTIQVDTGAGSLVIDDPGAAIKAGFGFVAGERSLGAFPNLTVRQNIILPYINAYSNPLYFHRKRIDSAVADLLTLLDVRPADPSAKMGALSGGNQQKVLFARCLIGQLRLLLLDEPTAGIDVGAKARIHRLIDDFVRAGGSTIVASTDMPELVSLCDRILAVRAGTVVADLPRGNGFDEPAIRSAMGNT